MNWYYVEAGQQRGPISEAELDNLHAIGRIQNDTLVWKEGAPDWLPYASVKGTASTNPGTGSGVPPANGVVCNECGRIFPPEEVIKVGNSNVCGSCKPVFMQKMREGVVTPGFGQMEYAGFWTRFCASFVDGIIMNVVGLVFGFVIGFAMRPTTSEGAIAMQAVTTSVSVLLGLAYYVFFNGKYGATPGKMALRIKIVTAEGHPIGYGRALGRYAASILSALICLIGYIMAAFDDEKRALHDRICNTRVVKR